LEKWLERQGRFHHLFRPENRHLIGELQTEVDRRWERLLRRCGEV
jgi:pyruvate ferredoxin oxidoreductase beta subunit